MKKALLALIIGLIVLLALYFGLREYKKYTTPKEVHFHAGFIVFQNDKKLNFSDFKYMQVEPCTGDKDHEDSDADIQGEKAHLHDFVGDLVHVEREGAVWRDLFFNIHYPIEYSKTTAFINGKKVSNFENLKINQADSLAVFIGKNDIKRDLEQAVTRDYIETMAKKSTTCGE